MPPIPPNLVAAANVGSAVFGAISAYNSFRQLAELRDINSKLDRVIGLQLETLQAIKNLGIQFRQDLEAAFIRDLDLELKANQQSFAALTSVLQETRRGLRFPTGGPNYAQRLEDLMFKTQDFTNKLALYGPATYQALVVNVALVETMFKIAGVDLAYRVAFHEQRIVDYAAFRGHYSSIHSGLSASNTELYAANSGESIRLYSFPDPNSVDFRLVVFEARGNPADSYQARQLLCTGQRCGEVQPWRDIDSTPYRNRERLITARDTYRATAFKVATIEQSIFPLFDTATVSSSKLIAVYRS